MDFKYSCFDCGSEEGDCTSFRCNICGVSVCKKCLVDKHYSPMGDHKCLSCDIVIDKWSMCVSDMTCLRCSTKIPTTVCQTCVRKHVILEKNISTCSKCQRVGCSSSVKNCCYFLCDEKVCFKCGYGCEDNCGLLMCSLKHADDVKCTKCGCFPARCQSCQIRCGKSDWPTCIECMGGFCPGKYMQRPESFEQRKLG